MTNTKIYLSILSPRLTEKQLIVAISDVHSLIDGIHLDVMDGKFVESSTLDWQTPNLLHKLKNAFPNLAYSVHLMVERPEAYIRRYAAAGADEIFLHAETVKFNQIAQIAYKLKKRRVKTGIAINPETSVEHFDRIADVLDSALIMSVHPGKGGQKFILESANKVKQLSEKFPKLVVAVDGGIDEKYAELCKIMGAKTLVIGSSILKQKNPFEAAFKIRKTLKQ